MILLYILAACSLFAIFVLFLVLSKTLNNIMNNLVKLQYLLQKELDYKKEQQAIKKLVDEQQADAKQHEETGENADEAVPPAESGPVKKR